MPGTTSICVWHGARAEEVTGGRGKASSQRPVGRSLVGTLVWSLRCQMDFSWLWRASKEPGLWKAVFCCFWLAALRALKSECIPFACSKAVAGNVICASMRKTHKGFPLSASLEFGETRYLAQDRAANLPSCFTSLWLRVGRLLRATCKHAAP